MRILLTGHKGFIGSYLHEALIESGHVVFGADKKNGKQENILNIETSPYFKWLAKQKIEIVVSLAAIARVRDSVENPNLAMENIQILYNMMEFARKNKIKKLLFTSSRETYGNINIKNYTELEARHYNCESPYAMSKLCGEAMIVAWNKCYNMKGVVVRLSNVFGKNDPNDRFVPRMFKLIPKNKPVEIYGKDKVLDFTYIDDCVMGIMQVIKNFDKLSKQELPIFNLAYGKGERLVDVAEYIKKKFNSKSKIRIKKNYVGEVVYYKADISKIKKLIGFKPRFNAYQGIDAMIDAK